MHEVGTKLGVKAMALFATVALLFACLPLVVAPQTALAATDSSRVSLVAPTETVRVGDTFTVDVAITHNGVIAAAEIDLTYDTTLASLTSISYAQGITNGYEHGVDRTTGVIKLSFLGATRLNAAQGVTVATLTFTSLDEGNFTITVPSAYAGEPPTGTSPMTDVTLTTPSNLVIPIEEAVSFEVSNNPYAAGYYLVYYTIDVPQGKVPSVEGNPMMLLNGAYVGLVQGSQLANLDSDSFVMFTGSAQIVRRSGDVNGNGRINIIDAQLAYDLASGGYSDFSIMTYSAWLASDVNNDGVVDSSDALAIQYKVHTGAFGN